MVYSTSYRSQLKKEISDIQGSFGAYAPMRFDMGLLSDEQTSDRALYFMAKMWRDTVAMNYSGQQNMQFAPQAQYAQVPQASESKYRHLVFFRDGDGAYKLIDKADDCRLLATMHPGPGSFEFTGAERFINMIGGRGELGQIVKMAEDHDLLRDHTYAHATEKSA